MLLLGRSPRDAGKPCIQVIKTFSRRKLMAYRIGRQKEENKGLLRGNVIRTQLNNIMPYKCAKYRTITFSHTY